MYLSDNEIIGLSDVACVAKYGRYNFITFSDNSDIFQLLCIIVPTKDDVAAFKDIDPASLGESESIRAPSKTGAAAAPQPKVEAPSTPPPPTPRPTTAHHAAQPAPGGRVKASPYAKKLAADQGVDLSVIYR